MNLETILPFAPFLAILYLLFALVQAARKKQQGIGAAIVALVALGVPLAALVLAPDTIVRAQMAGYLTLNAIIVFVGSIIILMIERGNRARAANRSYGMLGIGLGVLIAVVSIAYPLVFGTQTVARSRSDAFTGAQTSDGTTQNVAQTTSGTGEGTGTGTGTTGTTSAAAEVLTAQTGLTAEELTTQLQSGSKVADLVAAHNGDLNAVITAVAGALDTLKSEGGRRAQMLETMGTDTTAIATQFVNGELEGRAQQILGVVVLGGGSGFGGQNATSDQGGQFPVANNTNGTPVAPSGFGNPPVDANGTPFAPSNGDNPPANSNAQGQNQVASVATQQPTEPATPTEAVIRPTVISFPSATPTPAVTGVTTENAESTEAAESAVSSSTATCTVTPLYNLNLREEPDTDGKIYLSIPFGTSVTSDGKDSSGWYHVSYDGQAGWVSGEYLSAAPTCDGIAILKAS